MMRRISALTLAGALAACGSDPDPAQYGPDPTLPKMQRGLLPNMEITRPAGWGSDKPTVPKG